MEHQKVCPLCQGRGKLPTWFYGFGSCSIEDARNNKFPATCHVCLGKGVISVGVNSLSTPRHEP